MTARSISNDLSKGFDTLTDTVKGFVEAGTDRAVDLKDTTIDTASKFATQATKLIKKHPLTAVAIAFGVGYIAMRLVR